MDDVTKRLVNWLTGSETGVSSKNMVRVFVGLDHDKSVFGGYPHDPSDFGRCYKLLQAVPEVKGAFSELAKRSDVWARLIANWDELERLYLRDVETGQSTEMYDLMKSLGA